MRGTRVTEVPLPDLRAVRAFVRLEHDFMTGCPLYWPPPDDAVIRRLTGASALPADGERALFVAEQDGLPVARCAALVDGSWPARQQAGTGFIACFAARDRASAATARLLARAEAWLARRGAVRVLLPHDGSPKVDLAVLTRAGTGCPPFPLPWNPPFYVDYLTAAGYAARYPMSTFHVDFRSPLYRDACARVTGDCGFTDRSIDEWRWDADLELLRGLSNAVLGETHTAAQFTELFGWMRPPFEPRFIRFAFDGDRPAGFVVAVPDLADALRALRGRAGLAEAVRVATTDRPAPGVCAVAGGLLPRYRNRRAGSMLGRLFRDLESMGLQGASYGPVADANAASRRLVTSFGGTVTSTHACFAKRLAVPQASRP